MPSDWCKLLITIGENRSPERVQSRKPKPGSRVPINLNADMLMREIVDAGNDAGEYVSIQMNIEPSAMIKRRLRKGFSTSNMQDYRMIVASSRLISEKIDKLLDEDGLPLILRLSDLHRRVRHHLGDVAQRERQHLPCPSCGKTTLVKEVQDQRGRMSTGGVETPEVIRCLSCDGGPNRDGTWTETEYQWLSTMVLSEREEHDVLKWLLAEAQWRLSKLDQLANSLEETTNPTDGRAYKAIATIMRDYLPPKETS